MTSPLPNANPTGRKMFGRRSSRAARRATLTVTGLLAFMSVVIAVRTSMSAPDENSVWQVVVILAALPWSLALAWLDLVGGFGDRAAWLVALGFALNVAFLVALAWAVARRLRRRRAGELTGGY